MTWAKPMVCSTAYLDQLECPAATRTRRPIRASRAKGRLTTSTDCGAFAAMVRAMWPSSRRSAPAPRRVPRTMRSHPCVVAVCKMVAGTAPQIAWVTNVTPAWRASSAASPKSSRAAFSMSVCAWLLSGSGAALSSSGLTSPVSICNSAPRRFARSMAYVNAASDQGLPPTAARIRVYISVIPYPKPLHQRFEPAFRQHGKTHAGRLPNAKPLPGMIAQHLTRGLRASGSG